MLCAVAARNVCMRSAIVTLCLAAALSESPPPLSPPSPPSPLRPRPEGPSFWDVVAGPSGDGRYTSNDYDLAPDQQDMAVECPAGQSEYDCIERFIDDPTTAQPPVGTTMAWQLTGTAPTTASAVGTISFSGPASIFPKTHITGVEICPVAGGCGFTDPYGLEIRNSAELFIEWINKERGGLTVAGQKFGLWYSMVEDYSSVKHVGRALSSSSRALTQLAAAQFILAPYSSTLTPIAAAQAAQEGLIMIASAAAVESAITQYDKTFGILAPGKDYMKNPIASIVAKAGATVAPEFEADYGSGQARGIDPGSGAELEEGSGQEFGVGVFSREAETAPRLNDIGPCHDAYKGTESCLRHLKVGFIQADAAFNKDVCEGAILWTEELLGADQVAKQPGNTEADLVMTIPKEPGLKETKDALQGLRDQDVNVIIACTVSSTAEKVIAALEQMEWTPLALVTSSSVGVGTYGARVASGWWQGESVIGPAFWYHTEPSGTVGEFTGMTSADFYALYELGHTNQAVSYIGASAFTGLASLSKAIETAVDTDALLGDEVETRCKEILFGAGNVAPLNSPCVGVASKTAGELATELKDQTGTFAAWPYGSWPRAAGYMQMVGFYDKVLAALNNLQLTEFFAPVDFTTSRQNQADQLVLQYRSFDVQTGDAVVIADAASQLEFPIKSWKMRRCEKEGPSINWKYSSIRCGFSWDDADQECHADCSGDEALDMGQTKYCESFGYDQCYVDLAPCTIGSTLLDDDEDACNWRGLCDDDGNCDCDEGAFGDRCEKDVANQNYLPLPSRYGSWGIAAAGIAFAYFCIGWTCVNRKTKVLKAAQPSFLVVIAIGCICCISAIFPASFDHRGRTEVWIEDNFFVRGNRMGYPELDVACNTQVWIYCLGFTITFGALLTKLWRVMRIVNNTSVTLKKMPEWQLWSIAMTPFLVQLGIVLAWWQLAPLRWVVTTDVENDVGLLQQHGSCVISSDVSGEATASLGIIFLALSIGVQLGLLLIGNFLCFLARGIPTEYAETKYIAFTMASHLQTKLFALLAGSFIYNLPYVLFIVKVLVVFISDIGTLIFIFAPKMYMLCREGEEGMAAAGMQLRAYAAKRWEKDAATDSRFTDRGVEESKGGAPYTRQPKKMVMSIKTQTGASLADLTTSKDDDDEQNRLPVVDVHETAVQSAVDEARQADAPTQSAGAAIMRQLSGLGGRFGARPPSTSNAAADKVEIVTNVSRLSAAAPPPPVKPSATPPASRASPAPPPQSMLYGTHKPLAPRPAVESGRAAGFWGRAPPKKERASGDML